MTLSGHGNKHPIHFYHLLRITLQTISHHSCNAPIEGPNHMAYILKELINDTIGAPLEPYK